jgi:indole-3-glycerol phosphate synthase
MKTILDTIVEHKHMEVLKRKGRKSIQQLEEKVFYTREAIDPISHFKPDEINIIAEFKRKSPSKGKISDIISPAPIVKAYRKSGAIASSILTDRDFFGGSFRDLENVRKELPDFPLLRKDFIIDPYQIHEAKAYGADIVLLIASILEKETIRNLTHLANSLGLSILLEIHSEYELEKWIPEIKMIGVNNRNLKDFSVDIERSAQLYSKLPKESLKISESGLHSPEDVLRLKEIGFNGFLMGERFMSTENPGESLAQFLKEMGK